MVSSPSYKSSPPVDYRRVSVCVVSVTEIPYYLIIISIIKEQGIEIKLFRFSSRIVINNWERFVGWEREGGGGICTISPMP